MSNDSQAVKEKVVVDYTKNTGDTIASEISGSGKLQSINTKIQYKATDVFGIPPQALPDSNFSFKSVGNSTAKYEHYDVIRDHLPILEIVPCLTKMTLGAEGFKVVEEKSKFRDFLLNAYGINILSDSCFPLKFCYDSSSSSVTDSFSNEFGSSMMEESLKGLENDTIADTAFMTNMRTGADIKNAINSGANSLHSDRLNSFLSGAGSKLNDFSKKHGTVSGMAKIGASVAKGAKFGFPNTWKNSKFDASYNFTIRLYNMNPSDPDSLDYYILGPLAILLSFVVPMSTDGFTYVWPYLCTFACSGVFKSRAGYISNISISKLKSDNLALNNTVTYVDVSLSFKELYNTMISQKPLDSNSDVPTLVEYLHDLIGTKQWSSSNGDKPAWAALASTTKQTQTQQVTPTSNPIPPRATVIKLKRVAEEDEFNREEALFRNEDLSKQPSDIKKIGNDYRRVNKKIWDLRGKGVSENDPNMVSLKNTRSGIVSKYDKAKAEPRLNEEELFGTNLTS